MDKRTKDNISMTQFLILTWGALLSPLIESLLPLEGSLAFLLPLFLLPFFLLWGLGIGKFCGEGRGLAQGIWDSFGSVLGRVILLAYLLWSCVLLAVQLRLCGLSFLSVGYREGSLYFILPVLGLFVLWMSGGSFSGFARGSTFYFGILFCVFLLVLLFSLPQVEVLRFFPLWTGEEMFPSGNFLPSFGLFGYGIYASFFWGEVIWSGETGKEQGKVWCFWGISGCIFLSAYLFIATGIFGAGFLSQLSQPFFQLSKGIVVEGGFQRVESIVLALWTLGDFILLGVLLRGGGQCGKRLIGWNHSPLIMTGILCISTVLSLFVIEDLPAPFLYWGNVFFAWVFPVVFILTGFFQKILKKPLQSGNHCVKIEGD
ncbi:MAG: GerAB/ArcD/ProY family transporter [Eubacteriales bacterium]